MSLKQKIVVNVYIVLITCVAIWGIWTKPMLPQTRVNSKVVLIDSVYAKTKYMLGDVVWHFTTYRHYYFSGVYDKYQKWECDTIVKITITKNKILYNDYEEKDLFDIDDSTQALCGIYHKGIDSLINKINELECDK